MTYHYEMDNHSSFILNDNIIGLKAELTEANYQREKTELANDELRSEIQDLNDRLRMEQLAQEALQKASQQAQEALQKASQQAQEALQKASQQATEKLLRVIALRDAEITAIHQSHTWRIGFFVMAPLRWIKRSKR